MPASAIHADCSEYSDPITEAISPGVLEVLDGSHVFDGKQHKVSQLLYQATIVVAILLFLISFWSC